MRKGKESMKLAMISQPMTGLQEKEIMQTRQRAASALAGMGYDAVNTYFVNDPWYSAVSMKERGVVHFPLLFLGAAIEKMSKCTAVYFCRGWQDSRGCQIEHEIAKKYGLECIYES